MKLKNRYFILRHGEALSNKKDILSSWPERSRFPLTQKGKKQIKAVVKKLKSGPPSSCLAGLQRAKIDLIFSSDLLRTRQTAEIVGRGLKIKPKYDKRLREYNVGIFNGKTIKEFREHFPFEKRFKIKPPGGETYGEIKKRMYDFLKDIDRKYDKKSILIISHQGTLTLLEGKVKGLPNPKIFKKFPKEKRIKTGELKELKS